MTTDQILIREVHPNDDAQLSALIKAVMTEIGACGTNTQARRLSSDKPSSDIDSPPAHATLPYQFETSGT